MENQEFDEEKYEDAYRKAYDEKHSEFDDISSQKLILSLIGSVNSGKSMAINALTGIKYTEVKARSGWTKEVTLYELTNGVFIADTPGLFDINPDISKKASDFVANSADIILFFLNAGGGITSHEKKAFNEITELRKHTIVVLNKIDTLDEDELQDMINQIKEEFDILPIPISSKTGFGIEELNNSIIKFLENNGKDLLFLKVSKFKEKSVKKWINAATATAFSIGALPIPGSDIVALSSLQVGLAMKIAFIYDLKPSKDDIMKLVASTITGSVGKQMVRWGITGLKLLGWAPGGLPLEIAMAGIAASVASSMTYAFGWTCNEYYKSGMKIELGDLSSIFNDLYQKYKAANGNK